MQQLNKLIEFRQAVYEHGFTKARDAQFELLDSLLLSPTTRSFAELSTSGAFRRRWPSIYTAVEDGQQDRAWIEAQFVQLLPAQDLYVLALDRTVWPHPQARSLPDRQYVHAEGSPGTRETVVIGHPYSLLTWVVAPNASWALPLSVRRLPSQQTDVALGVEQVQQVSRALAQRHPTSLVVVVADGQYGNQRFLAPLADDRAILLTRLRCNRVLYGPPPPKTPGQRGAPRKHGARFALADPATWGPPAAEEEHTTDRAWGRVRLRRWDNLHAKQDATCVFSVLLIEAHLDREHPAPPFWLIFRPPPGRQAAEWSLWDVWHWYPWRWPVEPSIRFRKQELHWTQPMFQQPERCDRWTMVVTLAQWHLYLARTLVEDHPQPWQPPQQALTPRRVQQGWPWLFALLQTPARPPQTRGKSPGWPQGQARTPLERHKVVRKGPPRPKRKKRR